MDIEHFKTLLADGREEEAQEFLEQFLASAISSREQGEALLTAAALYMDAENAVNEEHIKILRNAVRELSGLQKEQTEMTDAINLVKARKTIEGGGKID